MVRSSAGLLEEFLVGLARKVPEPAGITLTNSVRNLFRNSSAITDRALLQMPGLLSGVLGKVPGGAMTIGTGVLSGYFISARLPPLKARFRNVLPAAWKARPGERMVSGRKTPCTAPISIFVRSSHPTGR